MTISHIIRSMLCLLLIPVAFGQSAKKKIVILGLDDASVAELRKTAPPAVQLVAPLPGHLGAEIGNADALISPQLTRELLQSAKQLKWVQILNAGVEDIAPLVKETGITLT